MALAIAGYTKANSGGSSTVTSLDITLPSGIAAGDLIVIIAANDSANATPEFNNSAQKPTGYELINHSGGSTPDSHVAAFYKVADGSEGGSTVAVPCRLTNDMVAFAIHFTGADSSTPIDGVTADLTADNVGSLGIDGLTTSVDGCIYIFCAASDGADCYPYTVYNSGFSLVDEERAGTGSDSVAGMWGKKDMATAGDTSWVNVQHSSSDGISAFAFTVKPAAGSTTTGTLDKTDGADTVASTGTTTIAGSVAATDAEDTLAAAGTHPAVGTLTAADGTDTLTGAGTHPAVGTLTATDGADTLAGAGTQTIGGSLDETDGADTLAATGSAGPPKVILDTDMEGDNDDIVALGLAIKAHHEGVIDLVAVIVTSGLQTSAPAVKAFLKAYGLPNVPVGYKIRTGGINPDRFAGAVRDMFGAHGEQANGGGYSTALTVYRTALANYSDVHIVTIGPLDGLSELLDSASDGIYAGNGVALVTAKANPELRSMGGQMPSSGTEFNVSDNATATNNVLSKWPGTILFHPFSIGDNIYSRVDAANEPSSDPFKYAWDASSTLTSAGGVTGNRPAGWRESWDPCTLLHFLDDLEAVDPGRFGRSSQGTFTINTGTGVGTWTADGTGPHRYATIASTEAAIEDEMEARMNALVPPVSVNLIRQSAVHPHTSLSGVTSVGTFSSSQNTDVAPDDTTTADTVTGSGLGASVTKIAVRASQAHTFSIRIKKTTGRSRFPAIGIDHLNSSNAAAGSPSEVGFTVNTNTGVAYAASGWGDVTLTAVDCFEDPNDADYWVAVLRWTTIATTASLIVYFMPNGGDSATSGTRANTGGPTSQVVWGMQIEPAADYTALMPTAGAPEFEPADQVTTATGSLDETDGADVLTSAGTQPIAGSLAATDGSDTVSAAGTHPSVGTLSVADGADTVAVAGSPVVSGAAVIIDGADTISATGSSQITGAIDATDGADTVAATGTHPSLGAAAITDGSDTLASAGTVGTEEEVTGSSTITDGTDTLSASGTHPAVGAASLTDGADSIASAGSPVVVVALAITDGTDTVASSGTHPSVGSLAATDGADAVVSFGTVGSDETVVGYLSVTDGTDTVAASGVLTVIGGLSSTNGADTVASAGSHPAVGSASATDGADTVSCSGWPVIVGTLAANDNADTLSATGSDGSGLAIPKGRTGLLVGPMTKTTGLTGRATITRLS